MYPPRLASLSAFLLLALAASPATAQVYRWVDEKGTPHYSQSPPPAGTKHTVLDIEVKPGPPSPDTKECYTVRCQGERMEERLRRQEELDARLTAERVANSPRPARGLEFRKYISIQRGMSEGELLTVAGEPDFVADHGLALAAPVPAQIGRGARASGRAAISLKAWTYLPTSADPFTTTITLTGGRVSEIERVRKF